MTSKPIINSFCTRCGKHTEVDEDQLCLDCYDFKLDQAESQARNGRSNAVWSKKTSRRV